MKRRDFLGVLGLGLIGCNEEIEMEKKNLDWWWSSGGAQEDIIQKINSYQSPTGKVYLQKLDKNYAIWIPIDDEWAQVYSSEKELSPTDDQWESVTAWGLQRYYEVKLPDSKTGTWSGGGAIAASVATTADCSLTISFTGTGISFMSYKDSGAGHYNWSINSGQYTGTIIPRQTTAGYGLTEIISGLPYGTYSLTMTLALGTQTTFFYAALQTGGPAITNDMFLKCFYIIGSQTPNSCYGEYSTYEYNPKNALRGGHQWFAFSTKGTADSGINNWIPNHSTIEYASIFNNVATDRTLKLNDTGADQIAALTSNFYFATEATTIVLRQSFIGVNKDFPSNNLFDIDQVITWSQDGIEIYMRAEALTTIDNSVLYLTMHDQSPYEATGKLRYTLLGGLEKDNSVRGGSVNLLNRAAMLNWNGVILGVDKTGTDFEKSVVSATYYPDVNSAFNLNDARPNKGIDANNVLANTAKYYPFISQNDGFIPSGYVIEWTAKAVMGFVPDAYNTLKSYAGL